MQRIKTKFNFTCLFLFSFLFGIGLFCSNFVFATASAQSFGLDIKTQPLVGEGEVAISFSCGGQDIASEYSTTYSGENITIEASVTNEPVDASFKWFFDDASTPEVDFVELEQTTKNLTLRDCSSTGKYYLVVLDNVGGRTTSATINIEIGKKDLTITSAQPINKQYDGNNVISFENIVHSGFVGEDNVDSNRIVMSGKVVSADVGEGKLVKEISAQINNENIADNYNIIIQNSDNITVNINKRKVVMTSFLPENAVYNGKSYAPSINLYYTNVEGVPVSVPYKYVFESNYGSSTIKADLINAGTYKIIPLKDGVDNNYAFYGDSTFSSELQYYRFIISRAQPVLKFAKTEFVYNGEQQNLKDYVSVNNDEQVVKFRSATTTFTTYEQGKALVGNVYVYVEGNNNYQPTSRDVLYNFSMSKATTVFDISNAKTSYVYSGDFLTLDTSGIIIDNQEQELFAYVDNFANVGTYLVSVTAKESANYKATALQNFYVEIVKRQIDVSEFMWSPMNNLTYQKDKIYTARLLTYNNNLNPIYSGTYRATNAGQYVASVSFENKNVGNIEIVGKTPDFVWEIGKMIVDEPTATTNSTFVYDGQAKSITFDFVDTRYISVLNNSFVDVGEYCTNLVLVDSNNTRWRTSEEGVISFDWSITKKVVELIDIEKSFTYDGTQKILGIAESDLYKVFGNQATNQGEYVAYIILNDNHNYCFENGENILKIQWEIVQKEKNNNSMIFVIVVSSVIILGVVIFLTLQFTVVRKNKRKKLNKNK